MIPIPHPSLWHTPRYAVVCYPTQAPCLESAMSPTLAHGIITLKSAAAFLFSLFSLNHHCKTGPGLLLQERTLQRRDRLPPSSQVRPSSTGQQSRPRSQDQQNCLVDDLRHLELYDTKFQYIIFTMCVLKKIHLSILSCALYSKVFNNWNSVYGILRRL